MNGSPGTQTKELELFINRAGVPHWIAERAVAAAQVIFDQAGVDPHVACYASDKHEDWEFEGDLAICKFTAGDEQLAELWGQANDAANAVMRREGLLAEVDRCGYLAMRRALGKADHIGRAAWIEQAMAEFARHGYDRQSAYSEAQNDWLLLTNAEADIAAALTTDPEAMARRTIESKAGPGGFRPAYEDRLKLNGRSS